VPTGYQTTSVAYTESGALLSGGLDGVVRLWRNALPQASGPNVQGPEWDVNPAGRMMATVVNSDVTGKPSAVQIWDMGAPGGPLLDATLPGAAGVRYVSDTTLLTFGSGRAQLWDLAAPRRPVRGATLGPASSQWASVAGDLVAVQGGDRSVTLWRVTSARDATRLGSFPDPGVGSGDVGLTADGRAAIALLANANTEWWNTTDPARPVRTADTAPTKAAGYGVRSAHGVAVVEGPTPLSSPVGSATLYAFDISHGPPGTGATLTTAANLSFDVSADGRLLAAANADAKHVNLWDISDPRQPRQLPTITAESGISGLALNPDNQQLAVWNTEGTLQLWDISNPENPRLTATVTIAGPDGQAQQFNDVRYLPNGSKLLVSATSSVYVLDASPTAIAGSLCGYTGASVTRAQWQQYAPHIPYQNPCG
jgi:WD40 repeat protein